MATSNTLGDLTQQIPEIQHELIARMPPGILACAFLTSLMPAEWHFAQYDNTTQSLGYGVAFLFVSHALGTLLTSLGMVVARCVFSKTAWDLEASMYSIRRNLPYEVCTIPVPHRRFAEMRRWDIRKWMETIAMWWKTNTKNTCMSPTNRLLVKDHADVSAMSGLMVLGIAVCIVATIAAMCTSYERVVEPSPVDALKATPCVALVEFPAAAWRGDRAEGMGIQRTASPAVRPLVIISLLIGGLLLATMGTRTYYKHAKITAKRYREAISNSWLSTRTESGSRCWAVGIVKKLPHPVRKLFVGRMKWWWRTVLWAVLCAVFIGSAVALSIKQAAEAGHCELVIASLAGAVVALTAAAVPYRMRREFRRIMAILHVQGVIEPIRGRHRADAARP